jgi:hypothetical protein
VADVLAGRGLARAACDSANYRRCDFEGRQTWLKGCGIDTQVRSSACAVIRVK